MLAFLLAAGVLLLLTLFAVLRPLIGRSTRLAAVIAATTITASIVLYAHLGTPDALDPAMVRAPTTLAEARLQLERKLQSQPGDAEGWRLLGRAYAAENKPAEAARAYAEAAKHAPQDPDVLTEAAEARALANDGHLFDAAAVAQLRQALRLRPDHQRARWFLGISQRQAGQAAQAAETWAALLPTVDTATADTLLGQINEARRDAGLAAMPLPARKERPGLTVEVALSPALAQRLQATPEARVFVLARAVGGPPMPVAAQKHSLDALPLSTTLTDADSPMPTQKLSSLGEVEVLARLSMRGDAMPQPGDLQAKPVKVKLPSRRPVKLVIGEE